jgi:hypothetical protein
MSSVSGRHWTAEITTSSNQMKKSERNHMNTTTTTEVVSSPPGATRHWNTKWRQNNSCAGQKPRADWKK